MKNRIFDITLLLAFVTASSACGTGIDSFSSNFFFTSAQAVAPNFGTGDSGALIAHENDKEATATWEAGNPMYEIYNLLRSYTYPGDEGIVDMSNLYKTLHTAGSYYSNAEQTCTPINLQEIIAPYDFGMREQYNCAGNEDKVDGYGRGYAIRREGSKKHGIISFEWDVDNKSLGVLQGRYDESSGDLYLNLVYFVDYPSQADYCVRHEVSGNDRTNFFKIRSMKYSPEQSAISMVGKGYSRGSGNFFLFRLTNSFEETISVNNKYFCFPASTHKNNLQAADSNGSSTVDADCADYQDAVDSMTLFEIDGSEMACSTDVFNSGRDNAGTIKVNYSE